jgi:hypothetical protein
MNTIEHPSFILARTRTILILKIEQERDSISYGGMMAAPPAGYKYIPGQSRKERLSDWERMLSELDAQLTQSILS